MSIGYSRVILRDGDAVNLMSFLQKYLKKYLSLKDTLVLLPI